MSRSRFVSALVLAAAALLPACGPLPNTGLEIQVTPPANLMAGRDFNELYVEVITEDGAEQATTIAITATTPQPYTIIALMNGKPHTSAVLTTILYSQGVVVAERDKANSALITEGKLTPVTINLSNTGS